MTGALIGAVVNLTDAATIALNAAAGNIFRVTIAASRSMGTPTNPVDGQDFKLWITQGGTGSFTMTFPGGAFEFASSLAQPTLSTAVGTSDVLAFSYDVNRTKWLMTGYVLGFT